MKKLLAALLSLSALVLPLSVMAAGPCTGIYLGGTGVCYSLGYVNGITPHTVLLGNATSTLATTSPSTSGFVLTSNGVNADPTFKAATGGGTGTISTSTALVSGQAVYATGVATIGSVATSTLSAGTGLSSTGILGYLIGGSSGVLLLDLTHANNWTGLQNFPLLMGIGTTSPFAGLSIAGASNGTASLFAIATSTASATTTAIRVSSSGNLRFLNGAGIDIGNDVQPPSNGISALGSVGVGTTSPWGNLSISGTAGGTTPLFTVSSTTAGGVSTTTFQVNSTGNVLMNNGTASLPSFAFYNHPTYGIYYDASLDGIKISTAGNSTMSFRNSGTIATKGIIAPATTNIDDLGLVTLLYRKMYMNSGFAAMNFGIASSTPAAALAVTNAAGTTTPAFLVSTSTAAFATTTVAKIDSSGNFLAGYNGANVGLGTTSPAETLDVNGNINLEGITHGIIMQDTVLGTCSIIQLTSGALVATAHACQ